MKVWLVCEDYDYEGLDVRGVFATEESAKAWVAGMTTRKPGQRTPTTVYQIDEWDVTE